MSNILAIAWTDLRIYFQDRGNLVSLFILPVVMTVLLGSSFGSFSGPSRVRFDLLDEDQTAQSRAFIRQLHEVNPALLICPAEQTADDACNLSDIDVMDRVTAFVRIQEDVSNAVLVLPQGYGAALDSRQPLALPYYSEANLVTGDPVLQSVNAVLQQVNGAEVAAQVAAGIGNLLGNSQADSSLASSAFDQAQTLWASEPVSVSYTQTQSQEPTDVPAPNGFSQSVPGMATFFVVFSVLGAGMNGLVRERKQWTLQRLAVMPLRRSELLAGKILMHFSLGLIQFLIVFLVGLVVHVYFGQDLLALILVIVLYTLSITALGLALAPHIRSEMQAGAMTTLLAILLAALGGAWWPLDVAPSFMQVIGHLTPVGWAMEAFHQLLFFNGGLGDVLLPIGVLAAITAVLFGIGILTFRYD